MSATTMAEEHKNVITKTFETVSESVSTVFHSVKWVLLVIAVFLALALLATWNMKRYQTITQSQKDQVKSLMMYASKSAQEAENIKAEDALQALLHANYAMCYFNACKLFVGDETLATIIESPVPPLESYLEDLQNSILDKVEENCGVRSKTQK